MIKKILLVLLLALVIIQFIHPKRNKSAGAQPNYIGNTFHIPDDVKSILAKACNDCHSNNTRYPWYSKLQPVDWWMANHIREAKEKLNFDEYTNARLRSQYHRMEEVAEQVKEKGMPLKSYLWIHKDAKLTEEERSKLISWTESVQDSLRAQYPMDSLVRPKKAP
jgi:hypothetical protein